MSSNFGVAVCKDFGSLSLAETSGTDFRSRSFQAASAARSEDRGYNNTNTFSGHAPLADSAARAWWPSARTLADTTPTT